MRLSFVESRRKDKERSQKGSNQQCGSLSLTLYVEVLVTLATLDLVTLDVTVRADVHCHTALSIFFRLQVADFDIRFLFLVSHVCYLSFVGLFVDCVVSVAPNSN